MTVRLLSLHDEFRNVLNDVNASLVFGEFKENAQR